MKTSVTFSLNPPLFPVKLLPLLCPIAGAPFNLLPGKLKFMRCNLFKCKLVFKNSAMRPKKKK